MLHRTHEFKGHGAAIYNLHPAPGGFYSAAADGYIVWWQRNDPELGKVVARVENGKFYTMATLPDGGMVAGAVDGGVHWLYPNAAARNRHVAHHRKGVYAVRYLGGELLTAGGDGVLSRWDVQTGRCLESLPLSGNSLRCIAYHAAADLLAVGASDGKVYFVELGGFALRTTVLANEPSVFCAAFEPGRRPPRLISGGRDAHLRFSHPGPPAIPVLEALPAHLATVNALAFDPSGQYLATASRDKTIKLWDARQDYKLLKVCEVIRDRGHVNSVNTLCWLDDFTLLTAGDDRRILAWKLDRPNIA